MFICACQATLDTRYTPLLTRKPLCRNAVTHASRAQNGKQRVARLLKPYAKLLKAHVRLLEAYTRILEA